MHKRTPEFVYKQQLVSVEGQTDILTMGLPYICPYNVNSVMNPILVMCLGLGYFFNLYRGKPLVREGGVVIMSHPTPVGVPPRAPPELHRLLRAGARRHDRPRRDRGEVREAASPRTSGTATSTARRYAYHGVHPFYMWYWGAHALQHLGRVIVVGGDPRAVRRLGLHVPRRRSTTRSRWPATWSAASRRSPTCTTRRCSCRTSREHRFPW